MRSLIADDDAINRMILEESLQKHGCVDAVENGEQAIRAARVALEQGSYYDLICLDVMMPVTNGHFALRGIRSLEKRHGIKAGGGAKVVMTTALNDERSVLTALGEQCDHYLVKPLDMNNLTSFLEANGLIS